MSEKASHRLCVDQTLLILYAKPFVVIRGKGQPMARDNATLYTGKLSMGPLHLSLQDMLLNSSSPRRAPRYLASLYDVIAGCTINKT